jgi:putative MATE family efflux protein
MSNQGQTESQRAAMNKAPLIEGSLWKAIWIMSWPLVLTTVAGSITGLVDILVAGTLGSATQAAVGLSEQFLFIFMVIIMSISVGTTAIVSRAYGAGNSTDTVAGTAQSLTLSLVLGALLAVVSLFVAQFVLPLFGNSSAMAMEPGQEASMLAQGRLYLGIFGVFLVPFSLLSIINAAFRAIGDAKTPLAVVAVSTTICIAGDYLTVICNWPVAGLGVSGIAYSAIAGNAVAAAFALYRLSKSPLKASLRELWSPSWQMMQKVARIGVPSALQRLGYTASVFVLFFILSRCAFPIQAIASWTIGIRLESVLFMPLMALSMAVSSIVGQNLGAHQDERAVKAGWSVAGIGVGLMIFLGLALFLGAEKLAGLMSHDQKTVEFTVSYLKVNALAEPFLALAMILGGALQGAGDTRSAMWISLFCNWLIRLPILFLLALKLNFGPLGAWIAMASSIMIMGLLMTWRYQSGQWLKVRV